MNEPGVSYGAESPPSRRTRLHVGSLLLLVGSVVLLVRLPCSLQAETKRSEELEPQQGSAATNAEARTHFEAESTTPSNDSLLAVAASASEEAELNVEKTTVVAGDLGSPTAVAQSVSPTEVAESASPAALAESVSPTAVAESVSSTAVAESPPPTTAAELISRTAEPGSPAPAAPEFAEEIANDMSDSSSEGGELGVNEQPEPNTEEGHREPETAEVASTPPAASASAKSSRRRARGKARKRHKKRGSRREAASDRKGGYYLADSAFVRSAHLLPPPPPFTPPSTPEGRAFVRAVALCHDSSFNLNVGKKFIYLMSSAVTYFQQSRVKCAIAYAQMFREEDVPVPSEEVLNACAVALLRHSPDDCWIDVPDPRVVFIQGTPGTKLIEPPAKKTDSQGGPPSEADDLRRRQFKRAERLTLTLFKFSLTSRCHWCPSCKNEQSTTAETPTPDLLPKRGYEGPKHEAWRKYLDALNEEVTRDLIGLFPVESEGEESAAEDTGETTGASSSDTTPIPTAEEENARDVFFSANFNLAPPWKGSDRLPLGQSWMSRGRTAPQEGGEHRYGAGGYSGLGSIPAGAVFGGLTNPISRYAALLNYLQSRYNFQRLRYEIEEDNPSTTAGGGNSTSPNAKNDGIGGGTTQTLTLQRIDAGDPFGRRVREIQDTSDGRQFFTFEHSNIRARISRRPRKRRSSCDLMPQDQAAEAAKAALACGGDCVDTGEDLYKILRDGTDAPPADFMDTVWSQNDGSLRPTRLPRHPTAESLQRAYLNQLVSGCATSQIHLKEAEQFYFAQAASLHFFGRFHDKCLQAMDEMTLPLFTRVFADESRGRSVGMEALQEFLPVPAPYSGADQLLVNCAAAGLVASAMPPTSSSNAAASAEAIAAAAAAAGAPTWGAPTMKTRAALEASAFAYHHPIRGLMGRSNFTPRIPCWELDAARLPQNMSQSEFRAVVTSFADLELRFIPLADRRFLDEQLVPTVLQSLLKEKLPARIFLGYKSPAARAFVLARYMRARFKLDTPEEAGWEDPPPPTLSVEDQTIKAAEVAVNCGVTCTDTGQSVGYLIRNGLEAYMRKRRAMGKGGEDDSEILEKGHPADDDNDVFASRYDVDDDTPLRELRGAAPSTTKQEHHRVPHHTVAASHHPPLADGANALLVVQRGLLWIPALASLAAALT